MPPFLLSDRARKILLGSLLLLIAVRLIGMFLIPLTDTTEARYAEIARKMLETGNWVTPQHDYGVPFWAKPPLSIWLAAASMRLFGVNEFGARLPSLLLAASLIALLGWWTAQRRGRDFALVTAVVLAGSLLFFTSAGAVLTDVSLALCAVFVMVAFWQALHTAQRAWGYGAFAAFGCGLLAKGLLIGPLVLLPLAAWLTLRRQWRAAFAALPWPGGITLLLAIALPWYLIAEQRTPGFLHYFIVGEHIQRFLDAGWRGDRYGHAQQEPFGMIWLYGLQAALPWSLLLAGWALRQRRWLRALAADGDGWFSYLLCWTLAAPLFFTFAPNVIWSYALPGLPAFAVLAVELYNRGAQRAQKPPAAGWLSAAALAPCALLLVAALHYTGHNGYVKSSCKGLVEYYLAARPSADSRLITFKRRYYSAEFYTAGQVKPVFSASGLAALLHNESVDFLAIQPGEWAALPPRLRARFQLRGQFGGHQLFEELPLEALRAAHNH